MADLRVRIEELWRHRAELDPDDVDARTVIHEAIDLLDNGAARVAEVIDGRVVVHEWLKQAILLLFQQARMVTQELGPFEFADKIPLKSGYEAAGVRVVPGASARWGSFLDRGVILMPSYVNIGARVGARSMADTWSTVGSCAQIGSDVHLSGGVGIGGVLEPPQAAPVIIEDEAFIGSRAMVTEGARVGRGAMLGAGVVLNPSIPVIDGQTGEEISRGVVPPWCLVINAHAAQGVARGHVRLPVRAHRQALRRRRTPRQGGAERRPPRTRGHHLNRTSTSGHPAALSHQRERGGRRPAMCGVGPATT